jgi:catechol 2,3-dioxygenase-like lactoylglutathione lyase family enzyme
MTIELNHTIIWASDKATSARFLADILGVPVGSPTGPFLPIELSNRVTLDFADCSDTILSQHYAFLVGEAEFDAAFARIRAEGLDYWADPFHQKKGEINHYLGGRGCYFTDPDGHNMELLTKA